MNLIVVFRVDWSKEQNLRISVRVECNRIRDLFIKLCINLITKFIKIRKSCHGVCLYIDRMVTISHEFFVYVYSYHSVLCWLDSLLLWQYTWTWLTGGKITLTHGFRGFSPGLARSLVLDPNARQNITWWEIIEKGEAVYERKLRGTEIRPESFQSNNLFSPSMLPLLTFYHLPQMPLCYDSIWGLVID